MLGYLLGVFILAAPFSCSNKDPMPQVPPATAAFSFTVGPYGEVNFLNASTNATDYGWTFGDGTTSTDVSPQHMYSEPGTYTVTLIAGSPGGLTSASHSVVIDDNIVGSYTGETWRVYNCDNATLNKALTACTMNCSSVVFTRDILTIANPGGGEAFHSYTIAGDTLVLTPAYTETVILGYDGTSLSLTFAQPATGHAPHCRQETNYVRN